MSKYFDKKTLFAGRKAESQKRSNGTFFSSKQDSDELFDKSAGNELRIVGVANIPSSGNVPTFNVVLFDDGHQLSTSRFFNAKGLKWPVGGNTAKWDYINACLANDTKVTVTPSKVVVGAEREITNENSPRKGQKFTPVTYYFEEQELPKTDMSVVMEKEEGE